QNGCRSFKDIQTVDIKLYPTNRAACEALGLLGDDQEWKIALEEASSHTTAARALFVQILIFGDVSDPLSLWGIFGNKCQKTFQAYFLRHLEFHSSKDMIQS
ncbi:hypothetical protein Tco_1347813, partial [Tanacetum coccineum]